MSCLLGCPDQLKDTLAPFMGVRQELVRREANAMGKRAPGLSCHCDSVASAPGAGWWNRKCVCNRLQALSPLRTEVCGIRPHARLVQRLSLSTAFTSAIEISATFQGQMFAETCSAMFPVGPMEKRRERLEF